MTPEQWSRVAALFTAITESPGVDPGGDAGSTLRSLRRAYAASHGTGLVDAILAAVALAYDLTLVTDNQRSFPMPGLKLG